MVYVSGCSTLTSYLEQVGIGAWQGLLRDLFGLAIRRLTFLQPIERFSIGSGSEYEEGSCLELATGVRSVAPLIDCTSMRFGNMIVEAERRDLKAIGFCVLIVIGFIIRAT